MFSYPVQAGGDWKGNLGGLALILLFLGIITGLVFFIYYWYTSITDTISAANRRYKEYPAETTSNWAGYENMIIYI